MNFLYLLTALSLTACGSVKQQSYSSAKIKSNKMFYAKIFAPTFQDPKFPNSGYKIHHATLVSDLSALRTVTNDPAKMPKSGDGACWEFPMVNQ